MRWKLMIISVVAVFMILQGLRGAYADGKSSPELIQDIQKQTPADVEPQSEIAKGITPVSVNVVHPAQILDKKKIKKLIQGVFEVVVPKVEDTFVQYVRPLPVEKLPYKDRTDQYRGIGTAFSIQRGRFISAAHVFGLEHKSLVKDYYLKDYEGNVFKINKFYRYSSYRDAVEFDVIAFEGKNDSKNKRVSLPQDVLPYSTKVELGDTIYTVGNALGDGIAVRGGQVSSFTPEYYDGKWKEIRYSAPASPGNSGGPLINDEGSVVGIVVKKTGSENLNYALPITEFLKLSQKKSEFYVKLDQTSYEELVVSQDWKFESQLPITLTELSGQSQADRVKFRLELYGAFLKKYESETFPKAARVSVYLRDQNYSNFMGSVGKNQQQNWYLDLPQYGETLLSENQRLFMANSKGDGATFLLERPKDMPLSEFVSNPQFIHDTFLKAIKWNRTFAEEKILILSYGPAHESRWERDLLGRPWNISVWRTAFDDKMHILACSPVPKGVNCSFDYISIASESLGIEFLHKLTRNQTIFSYGANFTYWKDFLALDDNYLPSKFQKSQLDLDYGKSAYVKLAGYELRYRYPEISETSYLQVNVGYGPKDAFSPEVYALKVLNRFDRADGVGVWSSLSPLALSTEESKRDWQDQLDRKGRYTGKVIDEKNIKIVRHLLQKKALNSADRSVASKSELSKEGVQDERLHIVSCFEQNDHEVQDLAKNCLNWVDVPFAPSAK